MIILNTQGIVLRAVKYKENDLILTLFTRKLGKVSAIAKGARRNQSSLLSSCQLFSYSDFILKKQGNMYRVTQSDIIKNFYNISYDFEAFSFAAYIIKLVESSIYENQTNNRLFTLLAQTLYLYTQENADNQYVTSAFELKFLDYAGVKPVVDKCIYCSKKKSESFVFNIEEGGILCNNCSNHFTHNTKLDLTTVKLMEYVLSNDILKCSRAKVSKYILIELDNILKKYLQTHIGNINMKSLHLLKSVQNDKGVDNNG
ncbi:DNA repair protein RecO [Clostridioides mangenotii]|uniref:DNA repair protein RecO n=1 Tax=Metaclostridioides mangenotii TaxID=1540 RepID=UPI001C1112D7|nr:DNA repair protein RecO [Clostridioides mangenotii]MBU5307714.1 DNA repair protein RecO [Clostridioides mangenotii]